MQILTRDRAVALGRIILAAMEKNKSVRLLRDRETVSQALIHLIFDALRRDEERQTALVEKLIRRKDRPAVGTREWEANLRSLLDEEYEREGFELS